MFTTYDMTARLKLGVESCFQVYLHGLASVVLWHGCLAVFEDNFEGLGLHLLPYAFSCVCMYALCDIERSGTCIRYHFAMREDTVRSTFDSGICKHELG